MTNVEKVAAARGRQSGFVIDSSFVSRPLGRSWAQASHSSFSLAGAFTVIELIVVVTIIFILAGLVLSTVGYARKKGARARAETEIAAMSAACESYKADNGTYPTSADTNSLDPKTNGNPSSTPCPSPCPDPGAVTAYSQASLVLYRALSGDRNLDRAVTDADKNFNIDGSPLSPPLSQLPQSYFTFKPNMLSPAGGTGTVTAIADPFSYSYGYSTANQTDSSKGYNPTFDLWSTAGVISTSNPPDQSQWIKNW